ncbi:DNA polymerase III, subunit gamma and tau [Candidatus Daviesbacteria bacterium RIFCSPHIGHO2_02_FULL_43_12]|uniref:DNA polymerase III subunit gamma/tau n=1 Tax=Candidatus Daviesbacteria bacterium RIFCSPHIGHO2_02_FULL_43_12 TaxID=1797776 RepID=A0A1F5KJ75_9BACT|nr:MAG: DNA polymerase III, subunit gamma and tau [Candidatus Daviesbacteria bacterium RIFCSPHIGHO2_12_FULL_47_45]OGE40973.1 MAG: DNA polymerase III, subunit gamma and tau [Candidatus Daviesbacteria bacterium RIFCSPHIGHO2_02_FULL_43_12]OGE69876.1 MAG: DNA polymerase III, subunit gamma and tau [Candidatus Daviesbacteria bacterium RIFCSPLOWO2_01_FULL_43_15]
MVFYRKYRPQTLSELFGQGAISSLLQKAFQEKKLAQAYLLCGPRGTGKTSTARILAKMVNCEKSSVISHQTSDSLTADSETDLKAEDSVPCNLCSQCLSITDGSNLDLIEIDAASNRGIDDIRALRENIKLSPASASKKVYIIDEVHMLTTEAFNALLKTLEEPPAHVLFILATTEAHKIPATILSRVSRLDFQLASQEDLMKVIQHVVQKEGLKIEDEAISVIAKKSDGSFRDCLKILDQLASQGETITASLVGDTIQGGNFEDVSKLLELILKKDAHLSLELFLKLSESGPNLKEWILSLMDTLRLVLFLKHGLTDVVESVGQEKLITLQALAQISSVEQLVFCLSTFQEAFEQMRFTSIPSLPLELAIIESTAGVHGSQFTVHSRESQKREESSVVITRSEETKRSLSEPLSALEHSGRDDTLPSAEIKMVVIGPQTSVSSDSIAISSDLALIIDKWNYILETIRPNNYSLEAMLRSVKVLECDNGRVLIEVPYAFHQRILETPKSQALLESVLSDVLGKVTRVKTVIGKRPARLEELQNVEIAADDEIIRIASEIFSSDGV